MKDVKSYECTIRASYSAWSNVVLTHVNRNNRYNRWSPIRAKGS